MITISKYLDDELLQWPFHALLTKILLTSVRGNLWIAKDSVDSPKTKKNIVLNQIDDGSTIFRTTQNQ